MGALLVLGIHLADTLPDLELDAVAGVRGLAHRLGRRRALALCWLSFGATLALAWVLAWRAGVAGALLANAVATVLVLASIALSGIRQDARALRQVFYLEASSAVVVSGVLFVLLR